MFVVCVTFKINPGQMEAFLPLMHAQAQNSMAREPGCLRFDVCGGGDEPDEVFLCEIYTDKAAFETHLGLPHFIEFNAATEKYVATKTVRTYGWMKGGSEKG
ncbi:putative quinol monooxygenase [Shimia biformata]|uniref:putative quinol monooxygenase n=1 Tax=Shimia biformata TaxID=1294299 RepID=UPI00194F383F|nr:putative quinol monooxygenase [Shimia biformata]